jgi:transcriptional regulator with XRE-family HTH domain
MIKYKKLGLIYIMDFYQLGKKIRSLRLTNHLSQAELAESIDVSTNYIGQIERGDRKPSLETLVSLCEVLHTSLDYILSDSRSSSDDYIMFNIESELKKLSTDEKQYFFQMITSYQDLKKVKKCLRHSQLP